MAAQSGGMNGMREPKANAAKLAEGGLAQLRDLAPAYVASSHEDYVNWIARAIEDQSSVRNIALSGTYGTGKSSILGEVAARYPNRVIQLSLLTLGKQDAASESDAPPAPSEPESITNRIQKEVVKQLLYQQRPSSAPESRFRRIGRVKWANEAFIATAVGSAAILLAIVIGLDVVLTPTFNLRFADRPRELVTLGLLVLVGTAGAGVTLLLRALGRGRIGIERVSAGPATISLSPRSTSYFDEYLDEIIYFFENNSQRDIVIIEDLDRFDDPYIFESLRSLNGILNAAEQLKTHEHRFRTGRFPRKIHNAFTELKAQKVRVASIRFLRGMQAAARQRDERRIRFIYAMKDSVFEKLGRAKGHSEDDARADVVRANRTKFFELVIPVIPFVTHKNAADVMTEALETRRLTVSRDLIVLAARHMADMRLIHNTVNEYTVFKRKLLDVPDPVPGLTAENLLAMMMFKNAHPGDFENIRYASSPLDDLFEIWRGFVTEHSARLRQESRTLRQRIADRSAGAAYARRLGQRVIEQVAALHSAPGTSVANTVITYQGYEVGDEKLSDPEFWRGFLDDEGFLGLTVNAPAYSYGTQQMQLHAETLESLTGMSLDMGKFEDDPDADQAEADLARTEDLLARVRRASWAGLADMPELTHTTHDGHAGNFRAHVTRLMPSRLAADLVLSGHITSYFMLHVSSFYGMVIRPRAMTYVMRFVDAGKNDPDFELDEDDARAILRDQGASIINETSVLNIGIVDHVLTNLPQHHEPIARTIATTPSGVEFLDRYFEAGTQKTKLVTLLTPLLPDIFVRVATSAALLPKDRMGLLGAAIDAQRDGVEYASSEALRELLEAEYAHLPTFKDEAKTPSLKPAVALFARAEAVVPSLSGLSAAAVHAFRASTSYAVTRGNLEAITGGPDITLDALAEAGSAVLEHVSHYPGAYANALAESPEIFTSVKAPASLQAFVSLAIRRDAVATENVISRASSTAALGQLQNTPTVAWPILLRHRLVRPSFENVAAYISQYEEVDEDLAAGLYEEIAITDFNVAELQHRRRIALKIINSPATGLQSEDRARLASSLEVGHLEAADISPLSGHLVGDLIAAGLLAEDAETFAARLMVDWKTQSHAIDSSSSFEAVLSTSTLSGAFVASLLRDPSKRGLHLAVARLMSEYTSLPAGAWDAYVETALAKDAAFRPGTTGIRAAAAAGVDPDQIVRLLAKLMERVGPDSLRDILRQLGHPWVKVADRGYGVTPIEESEDARTVLLALQSAGIVANMPVKDGKFRVSLRQPPS